MFAWFRSVLITLQQEFWESLSVFVDAVLEYMLQTLFGVLDWFRDQFPNVMDTLNIDGTLTAIWASPFYDIAAFLIPVRELFAIWAVAMVLAGTIRITRFIIGWIPTIEG